MAGVSSESLSAALQDLETKLPTAPLSLAGELFSILGVLDGSAGLRRALTDPTREGNEKSALVHSLLDGKASSDAVEITANLATLRWADARDISDALETLASTVAIAVAEQGTGGVGGLEKLENDLFAFKGTVDSNHELQAALTDPQATVAAKRTLALRLVPNASAEAQLLISQAATAPRGLKPTALVEKFAELAAGRQKRWIAEVASARPLSGEQTERLRSGLNRLYGRELKLNTSVDPSLIGGLRVTVGDEVIDASTETRLGDLRRQFATQA
ncbi:ATP synthase subunit delta [Sinomonas cellulolyticus]|uniref:ATP synthase subunit delta n=1 Tax=Sinomonas cellulolyticus TaxID=2801916 RepID=A0ABS1K4W1_9MICC|nr:MULTISPECIES: F0F1 ATP synthase subunit delta [Sinomonas]MBL0706513.1 F0F1 ATP synthase subunit delta [Sinomonas cellulolyticus]GHG45029.1 ATP synthase subunit delta [Sinomonas sp. KCTC 49339]